MLSTIPATPAHRGAPSLQPYECHALTEIQLADRWRVHRKTLQRWRCEGTGPKYAKIKKNIYYPIGEITAFEKASMRVSTSERANP